MIHHASFNTLDENIELARQAAGAGAELALLAYPPSFYPNSQTDIYEYTRAFCDGVDIAVMLFPVPLWGFERLHPASLSIEIMGQLIDDCPNIVAVKAEGGNPGIGGFVETWQRLSERVVVSEPLELVAMPLAMLVPLQFSGTSNQEYYGSTVPRIFEHIQRNEHSEAMALYWMMDPARRANGKIGAFGGTNMVHRTAWKYQAWLNGYNGGPIRMPTARLLYDQMAMLRNGLTASGLSATDEPDEAFFIGRNPR